MEATSSGVFRRLADALDWLFGREMTFAGTLDYVGEMNSRSPAQAFAAVRVTRSNPGSITAE